MTSSEPSEKASSVSEYKLGIRHILIVYNQRNTVGDGCHEREDGGLSGFGKALVKEMNRVGLMVDVSHTGYHTSIDVFDVSEAPVVFSHSNLRALFEHERNIRDDHAKACAASSEVVGVNGCGVFLGNNDISTEMLVRNIVLFVELIGAQHVGLGMYVYDQDSWHAYILTTAVGSYIEEGACLPEKTIRYAAPEQLPELADRLLKRGYPDSDTRGILGENRMRVARQVWR